jgi:hypothetical protein
MKRYKGNISPAEQKCKKLFAIDYTITLAPSDPEERAYNVILYNIHSFM